MLSMELGNREGRGVKEVRSLRRQEESGWEARFPRWQEQGEIIIGENCNIAGKGQEFWEYNLVM